MMYKNFNSILASVIIYMSEVLKSFYHFGYIVTEWKLSLESSEMLFMQMSNISLNFKHDLHLGCKHKLLTIMPDDTLRLIIGLNGLKGLIFLFCIYTIFFFL